MAAAGNTPPKELHVGRLLRRRSIAVAGASDKPGTPGAAILHNIASSGFAGDLHLVSPTRDAIGGTPCLRSLADLPPGVDAVMLNIPRAAIGDAVEACIARGVGGAIVFAAGFSEAGEDGRQEQEAIAARCRAGGLALLGPNCMGLTSYAEGGVALTFESLDYRPSTGTRRVAIVAQSGATAGNIRAAMLGRGIAVSHVVTTGNEAVVRADDFIRAFLADGVSAIAMYVEQVRDPQAFLAAAAEARAAGVPIVKVHPGSSAPGRAAAQSHTGAIAGEYRVMQTILRGEAVALVDTMDELFDTLAILHRYPAPGTGGVGIVTNSGAIRGLSLDFCETLELPVAELAPGTLARLRDAVPPHIEISNPFDVGTSGYSDAGVFAAATQAMLDDPAIGSVLLPLVGGGGWQQAAKADAIAPVAEHATLPVAIAIVGDETPLDSDAVARLRDSGTPLFRSPDRALRAMAAAHRYAHARAALTERLAAPPDHAGLALHGVVAEHAGKAFLRRIGIAVPEGELATDLDAAIGIAERIGFPVAMKVQSTALSHKSDIGGVILGVADAAALRRAWDEKAELLAAAAGPDGIDGFLIERMAEPGLEMVVGGRRDPQWGPVVVFGLGGIWVEALDAIEMLPAAATRKQIEERLGRMRGARLLGAFRGKPARDVGTLIDVILKVGMALRADPVISEIDVNPLMVFEQGRGALALDALIVAEGNQGDGQ